MKLSYRMLGSLIDLDGTTSEQIRRLLTSHSAEIEDHEEWTANLEAVRTARVDAVRPHPDADKLTLCTVDWGGAHGVEVVCGAKNVAAGQVVCYAPEGSVLPGWGEDGPLTLERRTIRGVESRGMILSERELGLSEDHEGILVLPPETPVGELFVAALELCDVIFELDNSCITHRPDLWGHVGFARELSALLRRPLSLPSGADPEALPQDGEPFPISIADGEDCRRYVGIVIENLQNGPSPLPLRRRLESLGVRSIDLLVDLTNWVLLEQGQPMHAFDLRDLRGGEIRVRRALDGECMRTLDGLDRALTTEDLVIADAEGAVALAGVMGAENSEVRSDTTAILLESATFGAARVRRTALRLGLRTEASSRFEKSLDPELAMQAALRFVELVREYCPLAKVTRPVTDCYPNPYPPVEIDLAYALVSRRIGQRVADTAVRAHLAALGFEAKEDTKGLRVRVPSWRASKDIACAEDLVEEVGRIEGYEKIRTVPPVVTVAPVRTRPERALERRAGAILSLDLGYAEARHRSLYGAKLAEAVGVSEVEHLHVQNPTSDEHDRLIVTTAANLLKAAGLNQRREATGRIWEAARIFRPLPAGLPEEVPVFGAVTWDRDRECDPTGSLFLSLVDDIKRLLVRVGVDAVRVVQSDGAPLRKGFPSPGWMHPGRRALLRGAQGAEIVTLAVVGEVAPSVSRAFGIAGRACVGEVDADRLLSAVASVGSDYAPIQRYPVVPFDVAVVVPRKTPAGDVQRVVENAVAGHVRGLHVFDVYEGEGIASGHRSLALRCELFDGATTLSSKQADALRSRIVKDLHDAGWTVRTA